MRIGNVKIFVEEKFSSYRTEIWMIEELGRKNYNLTMSKGEIAREEIKDCEPLCANDRTPLLSLPLPVADVFLRAIQDHLASKGIKTKDEHHIEGELNANKEHLDDMRMIVKKVLKIE